MNLLLGLQLPLSSGGGALPPIRNTEAAAVAQAAEGTVVAGRRRWHWRWNWRRYRWRNRWRQGGGKGGTGGGPEALAVDMDRRWHASQQAL